MAYPNRILFMGTPDFAVTALKALCQAGYPVCAVVTQPDKPTGRGYKMTPPAVKTAALELGLPVYQPETLKNGAFEQTLSTLAPDLIIVAAYGKLLPDYLLNYPSCGCINIHGSLLPKYRGAAPIQRALINGETVSGITIMKMEHGLDTGDIFLRREVPILEEDNFETLHDKLAVCGAETILEALTLLSEDKLHAEKQNDALATYAAKIENADCLLNFSANAYTLHNQIRGLSPFPLAYTVHRDKKLKIAAASWKTGNAGAQPGTVLSLRDGIITVACGQDILLITEVLPEGKKRMKAADFINGRGIAAGDILG